MKHALLRILVITVAIGAGALGVPPPHAEADSRGCTPAGVGTVCMAVRGNRTHVNEVNVTRYHNKPVCNYSATIEVTAQGGEVVYREDSGVVHNGACSYTGAYIVFKVNRDFPRQSRICGRWFESGQQQGGAPCETIK